MGENKIPTLKINGTPIERKRETHFLGLFINEHMNWNTHIFNISSSFLSFHQESCPLNCALPMPGTADGDVVSRCRVLGRAGSVHHGADQ